MQKEIDMVLEIIAPELEFCRLYYVGINTNCKVIATVMEWKEVISYVLDMFFYLFLMATLGTGNDITN
ncbi:hypothetical protein ACP6PL_27330 [Dapis sp. BLCC M126]|uniref:hypothetical protein n=1 Tax=Dapis sp. BLCC M126 TaxID=3400189 RepID=UPI003CE7F0C0